jgi:nicotinamidase-related amidase
MLRSALLHGREDLLICIDMQKEQQVSRRGFSAEELDTRLSTCAEILHKWRERNRPIVHLKRVAQAAWFNPASSLTGWIDGWSPLPGEEVFEHSLPSAYSSRRFSEFMDNLGNTTCHMLGFFLEEAVLATAIDSFHRSHDMRVMERAVFSVSSKHLENSAYRKALFDVVENFAPVDADEVSLRA